MYSAVFKDAAGETVYEIRNDQPSADDYADLLGLQAAVAQTTLDTMNGTIPDFFADKKVKTLEGTYGSQSYKLEF